MRRMLYLLVVYLVLVKYVDGQHHSIKFEAQNNLKILEDRIKLLLDYYENLSNIVYKLGENDHKILKNNDKRFSLFEGRLNFIENMVYHLGENDRERTKDSKTIVPMLLKHEEFISKLKGRFNPIFN